MLRAASGLSGAILEEITDQATLATTKAGEAEEALADLKGRWYGPLAADPTVDPNGDALAEGDAYWNTTNGNLRIYSDSGWVPVFSDSSLVAFQAAPSGSVGRTAEEKLREPGVTPQDFGGAGDDAADEQAAVQAALSANPSLAPSTAEGGKTLLPAGAYKLKSGVTIGGSRALEGQGGHNTTVLRADTGISAGQSLLTLTGSFNHVSMVRAAVSSTIYDPATGTGTAVDCFKVSPASAFDFGHVLREVRASGGRYGFHMAEGLETHLYHPICANSGIGVRVEAYDTSIFGGITQDNPTGGLYTSYGVEWCDMHLIRSGTYGAYFTGDRYPINIVNTFVDTPAQDGLVFDNIRGGLALNTYLLKIGNNANASAVGVRLKTNAKNNALTNGRVVNAGTNYQSVFAIEAGSVNNIIAFWNIPDSGKTIPSADVQRMREQTVIGCTGDAARYNNVPRFNRNRISSLAGAATSSISFQLDWEAMPNPSNNMHLFEGTLVARSISTSGANTGTAYAKIFIPVSNGYTNNAAPVIQIISDPGSAISTAGTPNLAISNVAVASGVLSFDVTNNNATGKVLNIAIELKRSIDANGLFF